jgi:hypothetical protein
MSDNVLHTLPGDEDFHRSRRMYCIHNGEAFVAPVGIVQSHFEWFVSKGWTTEADAAAFLSRVDRGYYWAPTNTLYTYTGMGFSFSDTTIEHVKAALPILQKELGLRSDTNICFGRKDREHLCLGTLTQVLSATATTAA